MTGEHDQPEVWSRYDSILSDIYFWNDEPLQDMMEDFRSWAESRAEIMGIELPPTDPY